MPWMPHLLDISCTKSLALVMFPLWHRQIPKGMLVTNGCASCTFDEAPAVGYLWTIRRAWHIGGSGPDQAVTIVILRNNDCLTPCSTSDQERFD